MRKFSIVVDNPYKTSTAMKYFSNVSLRFEPIPHNKNRIAQDVDLVFTIPANWHLTFLYENMPISDYFLSHVYSIYSQTI